MKLMTRLEQARLFVMDEMSMVGRQMLGKIEFKVRNTLLQETARLPDSMTLAGRDVVLSGDPKQANPIGDEPLYRAGAYKGKGQNKPRASDRTPDDAWSTQRLVAMGMAVRDSFEDVCVLRQVRRYVEAKKDIPLELREEYKRDALLFLRVTRGMADCDVEKFSKDDYAWLTRRNRSFLQQSEEGRAALRRFDGVGGRGFAPLLMDGRKDTLDGTVGADKINRLKLEIGEVVG